MEVASRTDQGMKRDHNEDACGLMPVYRVYMVADGVGGSNAGEIASKTAIQGIARFIQTHEMKGVDNMSEIKRYFSACFDRVNEEILNLMNERPETRGMATTIALAYLSGKTLYAMNIGDSRVYLYRKGDLKQITVDHTYVNQLLKAGVITASEAAVHEKRHVIMRAVGAEEKVRADYYQADLEVGDVIVLTTDGLHGEIGSSEIRKELDKNYSMKETCDHLVQQANDKGGHDNITVICIKITEGDLDE
ncbi:MAG: Stp1/IreP family PP2C-type Ser/Thr phosphatase [Eubacterium sp.]|jgi:protein phosphatase|nr:Stp1/IreP family PP2C-type Ser/Thr phosphatase [Eubacterium sp.]MCH4078644.1 Stp1/IreP family PP2C-type Ser/Thr phosphatase [Eubacterium sp.]MCH4109785.1 Stp1/IreP family PP2C-type Ser/Thr phosphatase [Eubacterium sp.]MCI1306993.1 Stp1/IreP family PP2C-type Ser/Thr phosphatase [Eubacterium sp.]MCI1428119.1 Stp1/IreP family PP2C-type Ser/Thr phosphatase [Eubacterium sp.]